MTSERGFRRPYKTSVLPDKGRYESRVPVDFQAPAVKWQGADLATRYMAAGWKHVVALGHSGMGGGGTDDVSTHGWGHMLAAMLGATFENYARGGAAAAFAEQKGQGGPGGPGQNGSGGWSQLLNTLSPGGSGAGYNGTFLNGVAPIYPTPHVAGEPYISPPWLPVIFFGNNDLGFLQYSGGSPNWFRNVSAFLDAMRTIISRATASAVYEENHSSCAYGSAWPAPGQNFGIGSGANVVALPNSATNQVLTISVPADFQQGDVISLGFSIGPGSTGSVTVAVDGSSAGLPNGGVINFGSRTPLPKFVAEQWLGIVYRMLNLSAGAHTITVTPASSGNASVYFDYWQVEPGNPNDASPVSCIIPSLFKPYAYTIWPAPLPTDTDVDNWNAALRNMLVSEFPRALYVDIATLIPRSSITPYWYFDQTHPSNLGHAMIAGAVFDAMSKTAPLQTASSIAYQSKDVTRDRVSFAQAPAGTGSDPINSASFSLQGAGAAVFSIPNTPLELWLPAAAGDIIECGGGWEWDNSGTSYGYADFAIMAGNIGAPSVSALALVATGSLTVGQQYYGWMSGTNANGETMASGPFPYPLPTAGSQKVNISFWGGAVGTWTNVRFFRTTNTNYPTGGSDLVGSVVPTANTTNVFSDTGAALSAGDPPQVNTAHLGAIRYVSGNALGVGNGPGGWLAPPGVYHPGMPNSWHFLAQPGDILSGGICLRMVVKVSNAGSTRNVQGGAGNPIQVFAKNHGRNAGFLDRAA